MNDRLKSLVRKTPAYWPLKNWKQRRRFGKELEEWENSGRPIPTPHLAKQNTLRKHAFDYGLKIFVETGTYMGDMIEAMKNVFEKIYSIEISRELFEQAGDRFKHAGHVELINGDSGSEIGRVMKKIDRPALFWLDGHYSGGPTGKGDKETPIVEELGHIFDAPDIGHVIIIDDARCFGSEPDYPEMEELKKYVLSQRPGCRIAVEDDSIRITPGPANPAS